jgi:hypothetical protein
LLRRAGEARNPLYILDEVIIAALDTVVEVCYAVNLTGRRNTLQFIVFHKYHTLAERKQVPPLACARCGTDLQLQAENDNDNLDSLTPVLHCYYCDITVKPGISLYEQLREVVIEYYPEIEDE